MKGGIKTGCIFLFTGRWAHKLGGGGVLITWRGL